jgi:hypothetical protein
LYIALLHRYKFGQSHSVELLKRIETEFTLRFLNIYTVFYEFVKFELISTYLIN